MIRIVSIRMLSAASVALLAAQATVAQTAVDARALPAALPSTALPSTVLPSTGAPSDGALRWDRASRSLRIGDGRTPEGLSVIPDGVVVATQPTAIATNFYNVTPADRVSRHMPCESIGAHRGVARYCAVVSHVFDGSLDEANPRSADYGIGCVLMKRDWLHSDVPGEGDCHTIFVRQGVGDATGLLSNVAVRKGFAATLESYTGDLLADGRAGKAIGVQLGVVNTRSDYQFGLVLTSKLGTGLTGALRIQNDSGSSWDRGISIARDGHETFYVVADTGSITTAGSASIGYRAAAATVLQIGAARERDGQSAIDLIGTRGATGDARIARAAGADGGLTMRNGGAGGIAFDTSAGTVRTLVGGRERLAVGAPGVGFNGAAPIARPTLAPALPTDGSATPAQLAAAYNSLRAAMIAYGLAQ